MILRAIENKCDETFVSKSVENSIFVSDLYDNKSISICSTTNTEIKDHSELVLCRVFLIVKPEQTLLRS